MSTKLLVFAQSAEAAPTIHSLKAEPIKTETCFVWSEGDITSCYAFEQGWIVISGMGIHAAQMAVSTYAHKIDEVWNLGMAGALHGTLPIGEMCEIGTVEKYVPAGFLDPYSQECVQTIIPPLTLSQKKNRLISSDFPIHDSTHRSHLSTLGDLVDMEGYGVAYAAHHLGKKCRMWKIISDFASPGGRELIRKNKAKISERIAEALYEAIHESRSHPLLWRN